MNEMTAADYHALVSEKVFTEQVMAEAKSHGWLAYHTHDSRRSVPGFPDIVAVHPDRELTIFAELKTVKGRLSTPQKVWEESLRQAGANVFVWRPTDWDEIHAVLRGEQP